MLQSRLANFYFFFGFGILVFFFRVELSLLIFKISSIRFLMNFLTTNIKFMSICQNKKMACQRLRPLHS